MSLNSFMSFFIISTNFCFQECRSVLSTSCHSLTHSQPHTLTHSQVGDTYLHIHGTRVVSSGDSYWPHHLIVLHTHYTHITDYTDYVSITFCSMSSCFCRQCLRVCLLLNNVLNTGVWVASSCTYVSVRSTLAIDCGYPNLVLRPLTVEWSHYTRILQYSWRRWCRPDTMANHHLYTHHTHTTHTSDRYLQD